MTGIMRVSHFLREMTTEALHRANPEWWHKSFASTYPDLTVEDVAEAIEAEKRGRK